MRKAPSHKTRFADHVHCDANELLRDLRPLGPDHGGRCIHSDNSIESAVTIRIAFIGAATPVLSVSSDNAQGRPAQQVVLSQTVMKSMVANKPKSKTLLTTRVGMIRRSSVVATKSAKAAPTSVREISRASPSHAPELLRRALSLGARPLQSRCRSAGLQQ